jgi:competence protein ComEA
MPPIPLSRSQALGLAAVLLAVLVVAGRSLQHHHGGPTGATSAPLRRAGGATGMAASTAKVVVHVVGAVRRPGLYTLPASGRTADAVERAGGATRRADLSLINLAAPLADGTQIVVPRKVSAALSGGGAGAGGEGEPSQPTGPVQLNTATLEQLDALPGVGPVTAQKILDYRQQHGAFSSVDELDAIPGIGPKRLADLRELVAP